MSGIDIRIIKKQIEDNSIPENGNFLRQSSNSEKYVASKWAYLNAMYKYYDRIRIKLTNTTKE
jgi:hypothetical protein